jgi:tripartite-type tricarboxylate transporter receptor subunit TctC
VTLKNSYPDGDFFVPARTPAAIMERLHAGVVQALESDNVKDKATAEESEVVASSPKEFAVFFHQEAVKYRDVARRAGIKDIE